MLRFESGLSRVQPGPTPPQHRFNPASTPAQPRLNHDAGITSLFCNGDYKKGIYYTRKKQNTLNINNEQ